MTWRLWPLYNGNEWVIKGEAPTIMRETPR